jgi:alpha-L-rhamnosidase
VWQVTSWTGAGAPVVSAPGTWETGLAPGDWQAEWLASETTVARADRMAGLHWITGAAPLKVGQSRAFRWTVTEAAAGPAEFCLSAHETLEVWHNGQRLPLPSDLPQDGPMRWTQMAVFPVTLAKGRNVFGVLVKRNAGFGVAPPTLAAILRRGPALAERLSSGDAGWTTAVEPAAGWAAPDFSDTAWDPAIAATGVLPIGQPWPVYPANLLRRSFTARRPVRAARLHVTALGVYEPMLNGRKVGDRKLAPEFTDPSKRVLYQTYDVTDRVAEGANTLGFEVADGWYGSKYSSAGLRPGAVPPAGPARTRLCRRHPRDRGHRQGLGNRRICRAQRRQL